MESRLIMALSSVGMMALAVLLAYIDRRFFPWQMMAYHSAKGYPGAANGALWGNILLMPFVFYIAWSYASQWGRAERDVMFVIGGLLGYYAFVLIYRNGLHDDAWAGKGEIHPAGVVAALYTAGLIATFILFYVCSTVKQADVVIIGALLLLYVPLANHFVLNGMNEWRHYLWCPRVYAEEARPMNILIRGEIFAAAITALKFLFPRAWLIL